MTNDWERWLAEYKTQWAAHTAGTRDTEAACPEEGVRRLADPALQDITWLTDAMAEHPRVLRGEVTLAWSHMLVVDALRQAQSISEALFVPVMDAGIDEVDPSDNRWFIQPCMRVFGPRRVNEYLLEVLAHGSDSRKAGSANAMYWAQVPPEFPADLQATLHGTMPESHSVDASLADQSLVDVWERRRAALLVTFVQNENLHVRRAVIGKLRLDPSTYPEELGRLVPSAIEIARASGDEYIRHRVEIQFGAALPPRVLPHRPKPSARG